MRRLWFFTAVLVSVTSFAQAPKTGGKATLKGSKHEQAPRIDLELPSFNSIPSDQKLESATGTESQQGQPQGPKVDEGYSVVRVVHGKSFTRTAEGAKPTHPLAAVATHGSNPTMMERFSTVVRVKSPGKQNAPIEVVVLDPRGDTVMEASGQLRFGTGVESEWQVDWDPTPIRAPGEFQVLVRVGGDPLGTTPLKVGAQ